MKKFLSFFIFIICILFSSSIQAQDIYKTSANLNLRILPTTSSGIITVIPCGNQIILLKHINNEWAEVKYKGYVSYVSKKYLRPSKTQRNYSRHNTSRYYRNVEGVRVQSPTHYHSIPAGATAICNDGTYSFSRNRRGTCSHHGGVAVWLN